MPTEVEEKTYNQIEQEHILLIIDSMTQDKHLPESLYIMTTPGDNWKFENDICKKFNGFRPDQPNVKRIVSFEDDPLAFAKKDKHKPENGKVFLYPMDYASGSKFLNEQSKKKFNIIWLTFNSVPRWDHIEKIANIVQNNVDESALIVLSFNVKFKRNQNMTSILEEIKEGAHHHNVLQYKSGINEFIDAAATDYELGHIASECFITLLTRILSSIHNKFDGALCYSNYSVDESSNMTLAFCVGSENNYVKGIQFASEAFFYRSNIETPHEKFLARNINKIEVNDVTFNEAIYSGGLGHGSYLGQLTWHEQFNNCPLNTYVFIKAFKRKSNIKSTQRVVAHRTHERSKMFESIDGKHYKAYQWSELQPYIWRCKNLRTRRAVQDHNNEIRRAERENS